MSDPKFTPGPWIVDHGGTLGHIKSVVEGEFWTPTVAKYETLAIISDEAKKANANLIAKSPNMYDFIHRLIDDSQLDIGWREEAEKLLAECRGET
jgi:hypothetical protein